MLGIIQSHGLWHYKDNTGIIHATPYSYIFQYLVYVAVPIMALFLFTVFIGAVVYGFLGYHLYLIYKGTTTNETFKWGDVNRARKQFLVNQERKQKNSSLIMDIAEDEAPFVQGKPLVNIYNRGFFMNLYEVFFPLNPKTRHSVTPHPHYAATQSNAKKLSQATPPTATSKKRD